MVVFLVDLKRGRIDVGVYIFLTFLGTVIIRVDGAVLL